MAVPEPARPTPPPAGFVRQHRVALAVAAVGGLAAIAWVAFGWFGVQGLWVDDEVDEAAPVFGFRRHRRASRRLAPRSGR